MGLCTLHSAHSRCFMIIWLFIYLSGRFKVVFLFHSCMGPTIFTNYLSCPPKILTVSPLENHKNLRAVVFTIDFITLDIVSTTKRNVLCLCRLIVFIIFRWSCSRDLHPSPPRPTLPSLCSGGWTSSSSSLRSRSGEIQTTSGLGSTSSTLSRIVNRNWTGTISS